MIKPNRSWTTGLGLKTLATLLLSTLLVSCGSSSKYDEFIPTRIVSAGDGMSYLDANASAVSFASSGALSNFKNRFTVVEDSGIDHWVKQFASGYGLTTLGDRNSTAAQIIVLNNEAPIPARHNDPTGPADVMLSTTTGTLTTTIQSQLNGFLPRVDDLLVMSVGLGDILKLSEDFASGANTNVTDLKAQAFARGQAYMDYANQLYQNGTYKRIILVNPIDLRYSTYAQNVVGLSDLIGQMTEQFTFGLKRNASTYPRDRGVWLFDATNLLLNINIGTGLNVNLTTTVCNEAASPRKQVCSVKSADVTADAGDPTNPVTLLNPNVLTGSGTNLYTTTNYFYAGSIFPTPFVHRYMGSTLYNRMRSSIGF
jgi:hypothetical protein